MRSVTLPSQPAPLPCPSSLALRIWVSGHITSSKLVRVPPTALVGSVQLPSPRDVIPLRAVHFYSHRTDSPVPGAGCGHRGRGAQLGPAGFEATDQVFFLVNL